MTEKVFMIAEVGVNHDGKLENALKLVDAAIDAGADAVKFQTFNAEELVTRDCKTADHQKKSGMDNQFDLLKSEELNLDEFVELKNYCDKKKIEFISTPYDVKSVKVLDDMGVKQFKVASAEIVNKPLLTAIAKTEKPILLATGMANLGEIERAVNYIRDVGSNPLTLLHCTSSYPAPYDQVNMNFLTTLKNIFDYRIGYSDHTRGCEIAVMAVAMGATVIEKHFTLDKNIVGPDHWASAEPAEFKQMVDAVRNVEKAFGTHKKVLTENEQKNILYMRRSMHSVKDIKKGEKISIGDVKILRKNDGLSPWLLDIVVGKKASRDIKNGQPITWDDL